MEKKETKKKSKTPIVVVIIALLAVAGFCYYKFVWLPEDLAKYEIAEEIPVETMEVDRVYESGSDSNVDTYNAIFEAVGDAEATYFTVNFDDGDRDTGSSYVVTQISKDNFDEVSPVGATSLHKKVSKGLSYFFNSSYDTLPASSFNNSDNSTILGKITASSTAEETIDPMFGGSVVGYFRDHDLVLESNDIEMDKVALLQDAGGYYYYIFKYNVTVKTLDCIGDMSDIGIFAKKGNEKDMEVYMLCGESESASRMFHIDYMTFK